MGCAVSSQRSPMGTSQSKKKSKPNQSSKESSRSNENKDDNGADIEDNENGSGAKTIGKLQTQSANVSSSQVNFFKMLDEKIENGIELDEADEEEERRQNLLRCVEEWDHVLGRSHDDESKIQPTEFQMSATASGSSIEHSIERGDKFSNSAVRSSKREDEGIQFLGSVDSMKTMFSNSVGIPAGTFREVTAEAEDVCGPPPSASNSRGRDKGGRPHSAAIGGRRKIRTPPESGGPKGDGIDEDDPGYLNCSIRLSTVLQDRESSGSSNAEAQGCN